MPLWCHRLECLWSSNTTSQQGLPARYYLRSYSSQKWVQNPTQDADYHYCYSDTSNSDIDPLFNGSQAVIEFVKSSIRVLLNALQLCRESIEAMPYPRACAISGFLETLQECLPRAMTLKSCCRAFNQALAIPTYLSYDGPNRSPPKIQPRGEIFPRLFQSSRTLA